MEESPWQLSEKRSLPLRGRQPFPLPQAQGFLICVPLLEQPLWDRDRVVGARTGVRVTEVHH